ncbi:MAG: glycosyltransferase family 9 protein [Opitutaceae bacterium]|nr:glycosyltransferase family 9 protein [Opitutaceae bacterium]
MSLGKLPHSSAIAAARWLRTCMTRSLAPPPARHPATRRFRAAIYKVDLIGDFVLALSAIRLALARYGESQSLLVVSPHVEPLAAMEFPRTERLVLPPSVGHKKLIWAGLAARRKLRDYACDEVLCLRHQRWDWDELVLGWLAAKRTHVLSDETSLTYYRDRNTHPRLSAVGARLSRLASGGGPVSVPPGGWCRELLLHRQALSEAFVDDVALADLLPHFCSVEAFGQGRGIGVAPFSSAPIKDCPEKLLMVALRELRKLTEEPIILWGGDGQLGRLQQLAKRLTAGGLTGVECAPVLPLTGFVRRVAEARVVLTVDSAAAHIATALDRPTLVLMGGGHYGQFGPWQKSARQIWLTNRLDCFGCSWNCIYSSPVCLTGIAEPEILLAVSRLWLHSKNT